MVCTIFLQEIQRLLANVESLESLGILLIWYPNHTHQQFGTVDENLKLQDISKILTFDWVALVKNVFVLKIVPMYSPCGRNEIVQ